MNIPVVIFKDQSSVYGVNVPGISGVHSWGDSIEDALRNAKEAITAHIELLLDLGEPVEISPNTIESLQKKPDHAGGIWALIDLPLPSELS